MGKKPLRWIMILQAVFPVFAYRYELWYGVNDQRPVDVITDVVNDLGVKILQQYSNHGNVAFSPMGVAFVLLALYEGSAGRGSQQIMEAVGLPANRDITRIGFRDIHRRLRTYLNADGFLGGLTLSRENTKLRPEYEDILRFYGFDLSSIGQETNITVSIKNASSTTELPKSTIGTTPLPVGMDTVNISGMTTLTTDTTVSPNSITSETTITESIAPSVTTQMPVMVTVSDDVQPTSVSATDTTIPFTGNTPTQTTNLLMTINSSTTSGENTQMSTDAENVATSSNTIMGSTSTEPTSTSMENQTSTVTMTMSTTQISTSTGDTATIADTSVPGSSAVTESNGNANGVNTFSAQVPSSTTDMSTMASTATDDTNVTASMEMLAVADTVNMMSVNDTSVNSMMSAISSIANETAVPSSVNETIMDNMVSELNTGTLTSMNTSAENIMTETTGSARSSMINVDNNDVTVSSSGEMSPSDSTIMNSTMITRLMGNRTAASLVDENTISMNRKRKAIDIASRLDRSRNSIASKNTVNTDKSTARRTSNFHKRSARSSRGYFSSYPDEGIWMQDLDIWKSYSMVNPDDVPAEDSASEISFLVNGCDISSVSASRYITVLPFAYFPSLNAVAIEFPLDDPRYNIILLMPTDRTDTRRLVRDLDGKSLRSLRKRLQPTWVRATIPSFMLRGFVTLTSLLQRLGILDVFEPRVADLSLMTSDLGVYARDVQQSIGVNIRNYLKPDRTHSRESSNVASPPTVPSRRDSYRYLPPGNGLFERAGPVPFTALHPFLYFIVDTETSVTLIAGRIDDPLNSRIL